MIYLLAGIWPGLEHFVVVLALCWVVTPSAALEVAAREEQVHH